MFLKRDLITIGKIFSKIKRISYVNAQIHYSRSNGDCKRSYLRLTVIRMPVHPLSVHGYLISSEAMNDEASASYSNLGLELQCVQLEEFHFITVNVV